MVIVALFLAIVREPIHFATQSRANAGVNRGSEATTVIKSAYQARLAQIAF